MYQDEAGRWVSDDGRYLWSGSDWLDLDDDSLGPAQPDEDPTSQPTSAEPGGGPSASSGAAPAAAGSPDAGGATTRSATPGRAGSLHGSGTPPSRSRRPLLLLTGLIVLVAVGVGVVLLVGRSSDPTPQAAAPSPTAPGQSPQPSASASASSQVLDESRRRDVAEAALLTRADLPGTTEERRANPTDVFLPCRAPALTPPPGTVLVGQRVSNSDFSTYAGQTVAAFASAREAGEAVDAIRRAVEKCAPYDYAYANSSRIDHITFRGIDTHVTLDDGGVYLEELDTPANYQGSSTGYGYGYIQRGQFLIRLTVTVASKADANQMNRLLRLSSSRLG